MGYRLPGGAKATVFLNLKTTAEGAQRINGLAYYLDVPYSQLLRDLAEEERQRLYDEGKRPPVRPPPDDPGGRTRPRKQPAGYDVPLNFKASREAADRIRGLAYYLGIPYGQMLRDLADKKRAALYAEGKRPPLRPPSSDE